MTFIGISISFIGIPISFIKISVSPTSISARQSLYTDILVLIQEPLFTDLQYKEINRLLKKDIFVVIVERDILQGVCIFNSHFINKIKHPSTDKAFKKSRLVVQAYNN